MVMKFLVPALGAMLIAAHTQVALADSADPEYASNQCVRDKRPMKVCCAEVLDGDKREIAECVKLTMDKRKNREEAKAAKASGSSASPAIQRGAQESKFESKSAAISSPPASSPEGKAATTASVGTDPVKQATDLIKDVQGIKGRFGF